MLLEVAVHTGKAWGFHGESGFCLIPRGPFSGFSRQVYTLVVLRKKDQGKMAILPPRELMPSDDAFGSSCLQRNFFPDTG